MENEIKVNEFVRLKNGRIVKVKEVKDNEIYFDSDIYFLDGIPVFEMENIFSDFIVKHSPNLIDLIECGDYVNGYLVIKVTKNKFIIISKYGLQEYEKEKLRQEIYNIETITTKEQFESISYKVKE